MNLYKAWLHWALFFSIQLLIENSIKMPLFDGNVHLSLSFLFLINTSLLFWKANFKLFYLFQVLSIIVFLVALLPHFYFFNIYSFLGRINYVWLKPKEFSLIFIYFIFALFVVYVLAKAQFNLVKDHLNYSYEITCLFVFLVCFRLVVHLKIVDRMGFAFYVKGVNENKLDMFRDDYDLYRQGANAIQNFTCNNQAAISPTIRFMGDNSHNKELLLIMESWGELFNPINQKECMEYLNQYIQDSKILSSQYDIQFGQTCFHGNTSSAEARELLNMNNEESYRAFLEFSHTSKYNIVASKLKSGYHTIASFPASKQYGSNHSNAEGFRKKLQFDSRSYYEELIKNKTAKVNYENGYTSVFDEDMIDTLMNESRNYVKVFAYGLTINTHTPFNLDMSRVNRKEYLITKKILLKDFNDNEHAFDQFYRIASTIKYALKRLEKEPGLYDSILFVGDHAYPDLRCLNLYNKEEVPYLLLTKKR
ncbi:hypothetical protein V7S76_11515 [Aquirufa sp. ROCK2-A2]